MRTEKSKKDNIVNFKKEIETFSEFKEESVKKSTEIEINIKWITRILMLGMPVLFSTIIAIGVGVPFYLHGDVKKTLMGMEDDILKEVIRKLNKLDISTQMINENTPSRNWQIPDQQPIKNK